MSLTCSDLMRFSKVKAAFLTIVWQTGGISHLSDWADFRCSLLGNPSDLMRICKILVPNPLSLGFSNWLAWLL